jgi:Mor family transcriptional regulator
VVTTALLDSADLIDTIFDFIEKEFPVLRSRAPALKQLARREFAGILTYIPRRSQSERDRIAAEVAVLFDGRNVAEVARKLGISTQTVYRIIKNAGSKK